MGVEEGRPSILAALAVAYGKGGQAEALALVDKTGEHLWEAELYWLKGELTLRQSRVPSTQHLVPNIQLEAEACFQRANEVARKQSAKSLELRAATSLARLWRRQGKRAQAHHLLSEIYHWFTEGFDTKDLQEAMALLEELK
jgi:predicted ATPase